MPEKWILFEFILLPLYTVRLDGKLVFQIGLFSFTFTGGFMSNLMLSSTLCFDIYFNGSIDRN